MNKLILSKNSGSAISFNPETLEVSSLEYVGLHVDYAFIVDNDCEVSMGDKKLLAKKGELVLKLYKYNGEGDVIILDAPELTSAILEYESARNKDRITESTSCCSGNKCCGVNKLSK